MGANYGGDRLIETLDSHGEVWVRQQLLDGMWAPGTLNASRVNAWLDAKDSARRDAKDAESLSISQRALRMSTWANIFAVIAILVAIAAIVIAVIQTPQ
jgi:hypothetical protein